MIPWSGNRTNGLRFGNLIGCYIKFEEVISVPIAFTSKGLRFKQKKRRGERREEESSRWG